MSFPVTFVVIVSLLVLLSSEYADEAIKQGKVLKEVAKEKLEVVVDETIKSRSSTLVVFSIDDD